METVKYPLLVIVATSLLSAALVMGAGDSVVVKEYPLPEFTYTLSEYNAYVYLGEFHLNDMFSNVRQYTISPDPKIEMGVDTPLCRALKNNITYYEAIDKGFISVSYSVQDLVIVVPSSMKDDQVSRIVYSAVACVKGEGLMLEEVRVFRALGGAMASQWLRDLNNNVFGSLPINDLVLKHFSDYGLKKGLISGNFTRLGSPLTAYEMLIILDEEPPVQVIEAFIRDLRGYIPTYVPIVLTLDVGGEGLKPLAISTPLDESTNSNEYDNGVVDESSDDMSKGVGDDMMRELHLLAIIAAFATAVSILLMRKGRS